MAYVYRNILIHPLAEVLHDPFMNLKSPSGRTVLVDRLVQDENRREVATRIKRTPQSSFRAAARYATLAHRQDVYIHKARRTDVTAYSLALADWFSKPEVLQIDLDAWTGDMAETIRVKARDNVRVTGVLVVIRDGQGDVIEMGEAEQSSVDPAWWIYTTRGMVSPSHSPGVEAIAQNVAGNRDSLTVS